MRGSDTMAYTYALINKETLAYICGKKGISNNFISDRTKLNADKVALWLDSSDQALPTIKQAKAIANCIHVPFAGLYMNPSDIPLKQIPSVKNMRTMYGTYSEDNSALNIAMIDLLLERDFLISAGTELEQDAPPFVPCIPDSTDPIVWANSIRSQFEISIEKQYKCSSSRQFYVYLRNQIENKGVFIQCFTDVPLECARGFALYESTLPIIGVNDDDRPPAKSFTIIHELVHLMKRESSLCNDMTNTSQTLSEEIFCNAVAGELLVPERALNITLKNGQYVSPYSKEDILQISKHFSVSRDVIIRRMLDLNKIDQLEYETYADLFRREVEKEREEQREARKNGMTVGIPRDISRETIDRTSPSISRLLYYGFGEDYFSKQDVARHLGIDQKHVNKFLMEVSTWSK